MAIDFAIEERPIGADGHVVAVAGEIDLFTAPEFKQAVLAAIDGGARTVVVDLTRVTFIDSSSLGVLIGAHRHMKARKAELVVVCDRESILKTFRITGLDGVFRLARSLDEALDDAPATA